MKQTERNQFNHRDSRELGKSAQERFKILAQRRGWEVIAATGQQDIHEHWDFLIMKYSGGEKYKVDVKARKRIGRWDDEVQDEWIWIEFHGVRQNDLGWLFGGQADLLAFETLENFVIITKSKLQEIANHLVSKSEKVLSVKEAKYKVYSRAGRPDMISLIEMKHIRLNAWDTWVKT